MKKEYLIYGAVAIGGAGVVYLLWKANSQASSSTDNSQSGLDQALAGEAQQAALANLFGSGTAALQPASTITNPVQTSPVINPAQTSPVTIPPSQTNDTAPPKTNPISALLGNGIPSTLTPQAVPAQSSGSVTTATMNVPASWLTGGLAVGGGGTNLNAPITLADPNRGNNADYSSSGNAAYAASQQPSSSSSPVATTSSVKRKVNLL